MTAWSSAMSSTSPRTDAIIVAALSLAWYLRFCSAAMASAAAIRAIIGARQQWQMARASASAASAGVGLVCSARILVTIAVTCALSASTVAGDGGLHLAGGVEVHVDVAFGRGQRDDAAGLRGTHHGGHVLLGEYPLDRDDVG